MNIFVVQCKIKRSILLKEICKDNLFGNFGSMSGIFSLLGNSYIEFVVTLFWTHDDIHSLIHTHIHTHGGRETRERETNPYI